MAEWRLDFGQIEVLDDAVAAVLRQKTMAQRVAMILACNRTMRKLIEGPLRQRHPDWNEQAIEREVARRMAGGPG